MTTDKQTVCLVHFFFSLSTFVVERGRRCFRCGNSLLLNESIVVTQIEYQIKRDHFSQRRQPRSSEKERDGASNVKFAFDRMLFFRSVVHRIVEIAEIVWRGMTFFCAFAVSISTIFLVFSCHSLVYFCHNFFLSPFCGPTANVAFSVCVRFSFAWFVCESLEMVRYSSMASDTQFEKLKS